jgi:ribosome recycling factor
VVKEAIRQAEERMKKSVEAFRRETASMKAGRATPALLDKITVDYYGSQVPINQVANIQVPEPRMLVIQPWERSMIKGIEKAILASDLHINPNNDGNVIRLALPALTEERRRDLVKLLHRRTEEDRVAIRNIRRDVKESIEKLKKDKQISEDEEKRGLDELQKVTDKYIKEVDHITELKEKEIMEV